jgi:hypothetical protein
MNWWSFLLHCPTALAWWSVRDSEADNVLCARFLGNNDRSFICVVSGTEFTVRRNKLEQEANGK